MTATLAITEIEPRGAWSLAGRLLRRAICIPTLRPH